MENATVNTEEKRIWEALEDVKDPEIPFISVVDLGIITHVEVTEDGHAIVAMTPTFTGCPALDVMRDDIKDAVKNAGFESFEVMVNYDVQWTSNMITEKGKEQLQKFGLGTPEKYEGEIDMELISKAKCPYCSSTDTSLNSPFGSALCRSIHICYHCQQTFEKFKEV